MYDLGDELLIVASNRISTYDVFHPTPIPDKGSVLTGLSTFWFERTAGIVGNHVISVTDGVPAEARGRGMVVRKLEMLSVECVVRGYITGSGWKDYQATGRVSGRTLAEGLNVPIAYPRPVRPVDEGQGRPRRAIDFEGAVALMATTSSPSASATCSIALYQYGAEHARANGIILADTRLGSGLTPRAG